MFVDGFALHTLLSALRCYSLSTRQAKVNNEHDMKVFAVCICIVLSQAQGEEPLVLQ